MNTAVIVDMDGTLADVTSIRHHVRQRPKDFDAFHRESVNVPPHDHVVQQVRDFKAAGHDILIVTARKARWRHHTAMWLALNDVPNDALFMRGDKDGRVDVEVKKDILDNISLNWTIVHAIDDNPSIIRLWEDHNIPVTIVPGWEVGVDGLK
jgi:uncharacterized HAD superfamily protein